MIFICMLYYDCVKQSDNRSISSPTLQNHKFRVVDIAWTPSGYLAATRLQVIRLVHTKILSTPSSD